MEEEDKIEKRFSEAFRDFKREPSGLVWEGLKRELHPESKPQNPWDRLWMFPRHFPGRFRLGIAAAAAVFAIFLGIIYFGTASHHVVSGHAYTGETRMCRGTAFLFKVDDKVMPRDSIVHYRSAMVDENGGYRFPGIGPGEYLLRVSPPDGSEIASKFQASWYDQHVSPDSAHLVIVGPEDVQADVQMRKRN